MLIQAVIGIAVFATLTLAFATQMKTMTTEIKRNEIKLAIMSTKNTLFSQMMSDNTWDKTVNHPSNAETFECALDPSKTCSPKTSFQLFDSSGNALTAAASQNPGLTHSGKACTGFDANVGNSDCPIGLNLSWNRICDAPCSNPVMEVSIDFAYNNPSYKFTYNLENLSSTFLRSPSSRNNGILMHQSYIQDAPHGSLLMIGAVRVIIYENEKTINLPQKALLVMQGSGKALLTPAGNGQNARISTKNHQVGLYINGDMVAADKSTSVTSGSSAEGKAERIGSATWSQEVGPGNVTIKLTHSAWVSVTAPGPADPKLLFSNLSYTVYE